MKSSDFISVKRITEFSTKFFGGKGMKRVISVCLALIIVSFSIITAMHFAPAEAKLKPDGGTITLNQDFTSALTVSGNLTEKYDVEASNSLLKATGFGKTGYLIYKFDATSSKKFANLAFEYKAKAMNGFAIRFYASTDNSNWSLVEELIGNEKNEKTVGNMSILRRGSATSVANGETTAYIKIEIETPGTGNLTDGVIDTFKVTKEEMSTSTVTEAKDIGPVNYTYDKATWTGQDGLTEYFGMSKNAENRLSPQAVDNFGYIMYDFNFKGVINSLDFEMNAKVAGGDATTGWGEIEVLVSNDKKSFQRAALITGAPEGSDENSLKGDASVLTRYRVSLDQFAGQKRYFVMIKAKSVGAVTNTQIGSIRLSPRAGKADPAKISSVNLDEQFNTSDSFKSNANMINASIDADDKATYNILNGKFSTIDDGTENKNSTTFMTYKYNLNSSMQALAGSIQGSIMSAILEKYSYIEVFAARQNSAWELVKRFDSKTSVNALGNGITDFAFDASSVAKGQSTIYVMIVVKSNQNTDIPVFIENLKMKSFSLSDSPKTVISANINKNATTTVQAELPKQVEVVTTGGNITIPVIWDFANSNYNKDVAGEYTVTATLDPSMLQFYNTIQPAKEVKAVATITVEDKSGVSEKSNGLLVYEKFETDEAFRSNPNLIKVDNALLATSKIGEVSYQAVRPADDGTKPVTFIYQVKTNAEMQKLSAILKFRILSNDPKKPSTLKVSTSDDNVTYTSIPTNELSKGDTGIEMNFLASGKAFNLTDAAAGKKELYIKIEFTNTAGGGGTSANSTWACLTEVLIESVGEIIVPAKPNGVLINETFGVDNWYYNNINYVDRENIGLGSIANIAGKGITTSDKKLSGYVTFMVNTTEPMGRMMVEYQGRTISNVLEKYSYLKFYSSDNGIDWSLLGTEQDNTLSMAGQFNEGSRSTDFSDEAYGKTKLYIKVEIFSVSDTWGYLRSIKVTTAAVGDESFIGFTPDPKANGVMIDNNYKTMPVGSADFQKTAYYTDGLAVKPTAGDAENVISPVAGVGFITYAVKSIKPIGPAVIELSGRAIRGSSLEFLISTDGVEWKSISLMKSPSAGENLDFYGGWNARNIDITPYVKNLQSFYLTVRIETANDTWGCLKSLKIVTEDVPTLIAASKAVDNGELLNENLTTDKYDFSKNTIESQNVKISALSAQNSEKVMQMADLTKRSYVIYGVRTKTPIGSLKLEYSGRAIMGSSVKFYVSSDKMDWVLGSEMYSPKSGPDSSKFGNLTTVYEADITNIVKGSNFAYIKVELSSGYESWASLSSLKLTSSSVTIPVTVDDGSGGNYYDPSLFNRPTTNASSTPESSSSNSSSKPIQNEDKDTNTLLIIIIISAAGVIILSAGVTLFILKKKNIIFKGKK